VGIFLNGDVSGDIMPSDNERLQDLLDDDSTSVGISSELYDRLFDEVLTEPILIPEEERVMVNWYAFEPRHVSMIIRYIARGTDISFNTIVQTALFHGFAIMKHKYGDSVSTIEALEDAAIEGYNENYIKYATYGIQLPSSDKKRMIARTDRETAEALGQIGALLGCSRTHLASICIFMALVTSDLVSKNHKDILERFLKEFDTSLQIRNHLNVHLT
jgi:hypothetical protein